MYQPMFFMHTVDILYKHKLQGSLKCGYQSPCDEGYGFNVSVAGFMVEHLSYWFMLMLSSWPGLLCHIDMNLNETCLAK